MVEEPLREAVIGVVDQYDLVLVTDGLDDEVSGRWESENGLRFVVAREIKPWISTM